MAPSRTDERGKIDGGCDKKSHSHGHAPKENNMVCSSKNFKIGFVIS